MVGLDAYLKQMLAVPDGYVGGCTQMLTFLGAYQGMQTSWFAQPNWRACIIDGGDDDCIGRFLAEKRERARFEEFSFY